MAPAFKIVSASNRGPTDNSALDNLWVVDLSEGDGEPERFRFSVPDGFNLSEAELRALIERRAAGFDNYASALDQFRAREQHHPEGSDRLVIFLRPDDDA